MILTFTLGTTFVGDAALKHQQKGENKQQLLHFLSRSMDGLTYPCISTAATNIT